MEEQDKGWLHHFPASSFSFCLTLLCAGLAEQMLAPGAAMEMAFCTPFQHSWGGKVQ